MTKNPITAKEIDHLLNSKNKFNFLIFDTIDSTNTYAKNHFSEFSTEFPTVIIAEHQTNGYGRFKRDFYSPNNSGIYLSIVLPISDNNVPNLITLGTGVAVVKALQKFLNNDQFKLKWVNDILLNGKKCGGILTESITDANGNITHIIVGIGLNVTTASFPEKLQPVATNVTTASRLDRNTLIASLLDQFSQIDYANYDFLTDYRRFCSTIGQTVRVVNGNQILTGLVDGIADDGSLILIDDKKNRHYISSGEVTKVFTNLE